MSSVRVPELVGRYGRVVDYIRLSVTVSAS